VCSQRDPGDTTASKKQQSIQYADEELRPYVLDPHKQTLIDLQYFVQELQQGGDEVILFLDANQDEYQFYRPQDHDACFKTKGGFQVDGSIDGSLRSFMANCGLTNTLTDVHSDQVLNTHVRGSKQIDFDLVTDGIHPCIKAVGILDESILKSDHREIFLDLDLLLLCGVSLERLERPQFRNLKLDDPRISDSYRKLLHKKCGCYNIHDRVQNISERGKADDWSNEDGRCYEILDRDITAAILRAADKCTIRKQHDTPWAPSLSKATHAIRYWTRRISRNGIRHADDSVLDHFLEHSDVDASYFDKTMAVKECASELRNAKENFKDVLDEATYNGDLYQVEVANARVERRYPHLIEDNIMQAQEREERIEKQVKKRETRRSTQKSFRKLGYQIRGHVKPNSTKKLSLNRLDVQKEEVLWRQIVGKTQVDERLIERNVEQFSHAGATTLGYTDLGRELGHTGDTPMAEAIPDGTFEYESLTDEALAAILKQLRKHPNVQEISQPIVTKADFKSAFKCLPEKTASSFSGRGLHHYKACAEGADDGLADIQSASHTAMMTVPLATGFCPERWKKAIGVMLEKMPGVVRSNKL
jgi:hypothetical protein